MRSPGVDGFLGAVLGRYFPLFGKIRFTAFFESLAFSPLDSGREGCEDAILRLYDRSPWTSSGLTKGGATLNKCIFLISYPDCPMLVRAWRYSAWFPAPFIPEFF